MWYSGDKEVGENLIGGNSAKKSIIGSQFHLESLDFVLCCCCVCVLNVSF